MPGRFNYELRHKYPHLIGDDTEVWNRFILKYPERFDTVDYDVKVGFGAVSTRVLAEESKKYWAALTKKRIDVVAFKDSIVTIIEVKKRVGLFTLGQILGYRYLYLSEHTELKSVRTLVVCSNIDQDDKAVLEHYGIDFVTV